MTRFPEDRPFPITIDGPASSGKSTIGALLATDLELPILDTGLLYRAVGQQVGADGADDAAKAATAARELDVARLGDPELRTERVGALASRVGALPAVRDALLGLQTSFAETFGGGILVGRDTGSVVCPWAPCKLFVTASVEARAQRRFEQLRARREPVIHSSVLAELRRRDERDAARVVAPLVVPPDALVIDTTDMTVALALSSARSFIDESVVRARH
ncbi:MAG: (d)CMP kinase [Pseudomonadota bacterium]